MSSVTLSYNAFLGDWEDDKEGGFDLWWSTEYFFDSPGVSRSKTGARHRAADVWLRTDGLKVDEEHMKWSWTAYHPVTHQVFAAGHRCESADAAKARCLEVIRDHFCNQEPARM